MATGEGTTAPPGNLSGRRVTGPGGARAFGGKTGGNYSPSSGNGATRRACGDGFRSDRGCLPGVAAIGRATMKGAHAITTLPGASLVSGSSMRIVRSRKAQIVSALVRRCSVISETVNTLGSAASTSGNRI